jgi:hypothetical protein
VLNFSESIRFVGVAVTLVLVTTLFTDGGRDDWRFTGLFLLAYVGCTAIEWVVRLVWRRRARSRA